MIGGDLVSRHDIDEGDALVGLTWREFGDALRDVLGGGLTGVTDSTR